MISVGNITHMPPNKRGQVPEGEVAATSDKCPERKHCSKTPHTLQVILPNYTLDLHANLTRSNNGSLCLIPP